MQSKEIRVLEPFFNSPKQWKFSQLQEESAVSKPQLSQWLKKLAKEKLIRKIKRRRMTAVYAANYDSFEFRQRKKAFGLEMLEHSGLLPHLHNLAQAKVVVLFGSFSRWDWYEHSDIDIFIFGQPHSENFSKFELKLKHSIEIHTAKTAKSLTRIEKLLPYIVTGEFIKGSIDDLGLEIRAKQ